MELNLSWESLRWESLKELPSDFFQQHKDLRELYVINCDDLDDFLPAIGQLENLEYLDLRSNLTEIPPEIGKLQNLRYLNLGADYYMPAVENNITVIPPEIGQLKSLQQLYLDKNQIVELPPEIGQFQNLQYLDLRSNQIAVLPPEIGQLHNLKKLDLGWNKLTALPPEIGQLHNLKKLCLSDNHLTELPREIGQLKSLQNLCIASNNLTAIPPEIRQLQNLQYLELRANKIAVLPPEIGQLQNLERIDITNNPIQDLSALANHPNQKLKVRAFWVELPRQYWTHLSQWKAEWLLTENNAELRRVLIQQIGYERICEELQTLELDIWREYTLLKIDANVDVEPIHLLKMTCPSTNHIHVLRVPPNLTSARAAIRWANWDVDPEAFAAET